MNNIIKTNKDKTFDEIEAEWTKHHTNSLECVCNPVKDDNLTVHNWVGADV